jgi:hypothetical protein
MFMKWKRAVPLWIALLSGTGCENDGAATNPTPSSGEAAGNKAPPGKVQGESANWRVVVTSAKKAKEPGPGPESSRSDAFLVDVEIEYLGPAQELKAPDVGLQSGNGPPAKFMGVTALDDERKSMAWLGFEGTQAVKTGDRFNVTYVFKVPAAGDTKLVFADIPPIAIRTGGLP